MIDLDWIDGILIGIAAQVDGRRIFEIKFGDEDVGGDIDGDGTGSTGARDEECFLDHAREIADVLDEVIVFCDGGGDAANVDLLK